MTWEIAFVFAVILAALALFVFEWHSIDQVALAIPVVLLLAGVISPAEAVSGFSHPATVTVASMLALSLGLTKTGAVAALGRWARTAPLGGPATRLFVLCLLVAGVSPFLNNTPVVVVFIPVFLAVAQRAKRPASKYMIPLSYAAILGGTVTLIGTSTNLIVYGMAQNRGLTEFTMFSITPLGLIYLVVGMAYLFTFGRALLPDRIDQIELPGKYQVRNFVTELMVTPSSPCRGKSLAELAWGERQGVNVLGIHRDERTRWGGVQQRRLRAGDILYAQGHHEDLLRLARAESLFTPVGIGDVGLDLFADDARLAEVLVSPTSQIVGHTLGETRFQQRYDVTVMAIQHLGRTERTRLADIRLQPGDLLLVHGPDTALTRLLEDQGFVAISEIEPPRPSRRRLAPVAMAILVAVVATAGTGLVSILPAALAGVVAMVFAGCVRIEELYEGLDWMVVFLLAGVIPLGVAMDSSGAAEWLGLALADAVGPYGPRAVIAGFYLLTTVLTSVMSNNATAVVLTPIALLTAATLEMNPYALLVAVMFGASAGFMTPVSYQTNTLVYGPGNYRFADFVKVGGPLNLLLLVTATIFIPVFWPS